MYSSGVEDENYLRGIAATDGEGKPVRDDLPRLHSGRWPHIHFEVYRRSPRPSPTGHRQDVADRAAEGGLPEVYATSGYAGSLSNLAQTSLSTDNVFSDDRAMTSSRP